MNLPNVFQNRNIGHINNDQEIFYGNNTSISTKKTSNPIDIDTKINNLFRSKNYVYKLNVTITTSTNSFDAIIIGKSNNNLITITNELIPIKNIIDIQEKIRNH